MGNVVGVEQESVGRTGAPVSFEDWVGAHAAGLTRFAVLVLGDQAAADDALREALSRAWPRWDRIMLTDDPLAYVRRMVVNAHISWRRRAGRHEVPAAEPRTETSVELGHTDLDLWHACLALPVRQRAALVLRFYEGLAYAEVARVLGISEGTARSQTHRALTRLRTRLEEHDDGA